MSRKVQELEARLGAQLMHRTTRKLGLTEAGNVYYEHSQHIARVLDEAESAVGQLQSGPRGWLRVTAPYSFGVSWIAPLLSEFYQRHPEVRVDLELNNEALDLIDKEIDVALRIGPLRDQSLVARRLTSFRTQVYASALYLAQHGEPHHPDELTRHRTFAMSQYNFNGNHFVWPLDDGNGFVDYRIEPVLVSNDPGALRAAMLTGEGLMLGADVMVKAEASQGLVHRVLAGWGGPTVDLNAVFPRGQGKSPKVRAFIDFLVERLRCDTTYMEGLCPHSKCAHDATHADSHTEGGPVAA